MSDHPNSSQNSYTFPNRVKNPFRVARAAWRVTQDLSRTEDAAIVQIAFAQSRRFARFAQWDKVAERLSHDPRIRSVLEDRPRLGWIDPAALTALPAGSLGRTFADHLARKGLNPNLVEPLPANDPGSFVLAHFGETHDIWHLVTGYGMDETGEASLIGFYAAQFGQAPHFALLLGILFLNTAFYRPADFQQRMEALTVGWRAGKTADSLFGRDWPSLWRRPIRDVRMSLGLKADPVVVGEGIRAAA
jgi:ubiquinone biosynthesis protein COQ4